MCTVVPMRPVGKTGIGSRERIWNTQKKHMLPKTGPNWKLFPDSFLSSLFPSLLVLKSSDCYLGPSDQSFRVESRHTCRKSSRIKASRLSRIVSLPAFQMTPRT